MRERAYGRIVNVASIAGKEGNPNATAYCAAKAGVLGFTKALAKDLVDKNILVNCVTPVITETELFQEMSQEHIASMKSKIPMGRFCTVAEIADMVAWVAGPRCSFTTGAVFDISGGRSAY
jgi:3-oxoacyl-[acyl-carrier protein] reductase